MSKELTPISQRAATAVHNILHDAANKNLSQSINALTASVLLTSGAMTTSRGSGALGLESLGGVTVERNREFNSATDANVDDLVKGFKDIGMPARHFTQVAEECLQIMDQSYSPTNVLQQVQYSDSHVDMAMVVGRTTAALEGSSDDAFAVEAFGDDVNRLATDDRLTMSLSIMRPYENVMDKAFARVNDSTPVVTIRAPLPQVYDWSATQKSGATPAERNSNIPLRDLYRNPTRVNTAPKPVVPVAANDSANVLFDGSAKYYKTGVSIYAKELAADTNTFGYGQSDRTDLISDGAILSSILVTVTDPSNANLAETFILPTKQMAMSMFTTMPANRTSGERQVMMTASIPITAGSTKYDGGASTTANKFTDATMVIRVSVSAKLNIQTGELLSSGAASKVELVQKSSGTPISNQTNTLYGQLQVAYSGFGVDMFWDEENQRKANLAVWCQYRQFQFVIPRSRVFFTEYALAQDVDENAISTTSSVLALGNGRRGLDTLVNRLCDVSESAKFARDHAEIAKYNALDDASFVSSLVKPTVVSTSMDFAVEEVNNMNESTRINELHGRFRARLLEMATATMSNSLMLNQYKGGEKPVFKIFTHSTIADTLIGILDYHPSLDDKAATATGADYSMTLPNSYRVDIIKTNWDCLKQRLYGVVVIESDMSSLLSAASIRDCGTVTLNYSPTNAGAVVRRVATTTREILMMSNPVGFMMEIKNIESQLGNVDYGAYKLNADSNDDISI